MQNRIILLLIFLPCLVIAQLPNDRNHPELDWQKFETPHFQFIYHQELDSLALDAAMIAEEIYNPVTESIGIEPGGKTIIILSDVDDISNGLANPLNHTIFIWTKSAKKETTGSIPWLRRVIGHEFTHIVTFWACRNFLGKIWELLTLGLTPTWFIEGVAQYESEKWDDHRDLLLRTAVRDRALLPIRKLDGFVGADVFDGRLVYEEGHGMVRYIASKYGKEKVGEILRKYRKFPLSFTWTMKRSTGKTSGKIFREWSSEMNNSYETLFNEKDTGKQIGKRIPIPLQVVTGLRWSSNGNIAVVGMERWDEGIQRLYIFNEERSNLKCISGPYAGSYFSWSPDGNKIVISRKRRGKNGSIVDDLFMIDTIREKEKRITDNLRATDPVWSPIRNEICYVHHHQDGSGLWLLNLDNKKTKEVVNFGRGTEVFSPSWSPDEEKIVFSIFDNQGNRDIGIVNQDGTNFHKLTDNPIDDRTPAWSPDGKWISFCSYWNGIPNLYCIHPDGSGMIQITDLAGGVFNPSWTSDGNGITSIFFEMRDSIKAYTIPFPRKVKEKPAEYRPWWGSSEPFNEENKKTKPLVLKSSPYRSLTHLAPLIILPFLSRDDKGLQAGFVHYSADPLNKHQVLGMITAGNRVDWWIEYNNAQLEPVITLSTWGNTIDRGNFLNFKDYRLWERRSGANIRFLLPVNFGKTLLSNHSFSIQGNIEKIQPLYPERFQYLKTKFHPFSGWINTIGLKYEWIWMRPDVGYGIHPCTGFLFSFFLNRADNFLGSDIEHTRLRNNFSFRQELPWKRHVLAIRLGSLYQWGEQPIQDRLSLGSPQLVRGLSYKREGNRFIYGNAEYRIPLIRDLGLRIPFFYFERFAWAFWSDWGKAWGKDLASYETGVERSFLQTNWIITAGGELRSRIYILGKLPIIIRGGYGKNMGGTEESDWYFMMGGVF